MNLLTFAVFEDSLECLCSFLHEAPAHVTPMGGRVIGDDSGCRGVPTLAHVGVIAVSVTGVCDRERTLPHEHMGAQVTQDESLKENETFPTKATFS